jgi:hypothetical protein
MMKQQPQAGQLRVCAFYVCVSVCVISSFLFASIVCDDDVCLAMGAWALSGLLKTRFIFSFFEVSLNRRK